MKKWIIPLVVIVLLASPWVIGKIIQGNAASTIEAIDQSNPFYEFKLESYQQGWLQSSGTLSILPLELESIIADLEDSEDVAGREFLERFSEALTLNFSIQHGPLIIGGEETFGLASYQVFPSNDALFREFLEWEEGVPLFELAGVVGYTGTEKIDYSISAFTADMPDGAQLEMQASAGSGTASGDWMEMTGNFGAISIGAMGQDISISPIIFSYDGVISFSAFELYDFDYTLNLDEISGSGAVDMLMENFELTGSARLNDDETLANLGAAFSLDSFESPEASLSDASLKFETINYSVAFHEAYINTIMEMVEMGEEIEAGSDVFPFEQITEASKFLIESNFQFSLPEIKFTLPAGSFAGDMVISFAETADSGEFDPLNPFYWASVITASANVEIDQPLLMWMLEQQARETVIAFNEAQGLEPLSEDEIHAAAEVQSQQTLLLVLSQGFLEETDSGYKANFEYSSDSVTVNGRPVPLPF